MITELGKLYKPVTTLPEEDGMYLAIITEEGEDVAVVLPFSEGKFALQEVRAWMPVPPVPDNFNDVCFFNVGNELELEEGETGSLIVHPPIGVDGASIEIIVHVVEDLEVEGELVPPSVAVILKSYRGKCEIAIGQELASFQTAQRVLEVEYSVKEQYGEVDKELVLSVLREQEELEEAQLKLVQDVFDKTFKEEDCFSEVGDPQGVVAKKLLNNQTFMKERYGNPNAD